MWSHFPTPDDYAEPDQGPESSKAKGMAMDMGNYLFIVYYWWTKLNNGWIDHLDHYSQDSAETWHALGYSVGHEDEVSGWPSEDLLDNFVVDEGKSMILPP
jgi:hypothetical protein